MFLMLIVLSFGLTYLLLPLVASMVPASFRKENYQGKVVPVGLGLIFLLVPLPLILFGMVLGVLGLSGITFAILILSFGILGLIDDTWGDQNSQGFGGHMKQLFHGRLTTGALKAVYGGLAALFVAYVIGGPLWAVLINTLMIALMANIFNLLDVRPGRSGKAFLLVFALVVAFAGFTPLAILAASLIVYLRWDLRAEAMLGDVGSNILGATLGLELTGLAISFRLFLVVVLIYLHLYSERKSLSSYIEQNRVLRILDDWGRS